MDQDDDLDSQDGGEPETAAEEETEAPPEEEVVDPRTLLTKEQVDYFREIFDAIDAQKKEKITTKSVGFVLRLMGLNPTKEEIKKHIIEIDPQNHGAIDFHSFLLPIAQRIEQEPETHEDIIAAFKVFDEEELDYVTVERLYEYLTTMGEDLEDFEIELLIKMAESKGTGKVYYTEFVEKTMGVVRKAPKGAKGKKGGKKK